LPPLPIVKIKLQGRHEGYSIDDFIVFVKEEQGSRKAKLLGQIKHEVAITQHDSNLGEVISAAWVDYNDERFFDPDYDRIALITGPLSANDSENARKLLDWARASETHEDFFRKVEQTKFSNAEKKKKLNAFRSQLKKANKNLDVGDEILFQFLRRFHILGFDLDSDSSACLGNIYALLSVFRKDGLGELFGMIANKVAWFNENAGTITLDNLPLEIKEVFVLPTRITIPSDLVKHGKPKVLEGDAEDAIVFASLLGAWNENVQGDNEIITELIEGDD